MSPPRRSRRRKDSNVPLLVGLLVLLLVLVGGAAFVLLDAQAEGPGRQAPLLVAAPEEPAPDRASELPTPVARTEEVTRIDTPRPERPDVAGQLLDVPAGTPTSAIAGRVETPDGKPLPGAEVSVYRGNPLLTANFPAAREELGVTVRSAGDGSFRIDAVPVGKNYVVAARHPDYAVTEVRNQTVRKDRDITNLLVRMERGASICGRVLDLAEGPIPGARVEFYDSIQSAQLEPAERRPWKVVLSDGAGDFCFEHVSAQSYRLRVLAPGFETQSRSFSAAFEGRPSDQEVIFRLDAGRDLPGRVVDEQGRPVGQVFIEAVAMTKDYQAQVTASSAPDGSFLLEGLGDNPYTLRATADGYSRYSRANMNPDDGELLIELQRQIGVEGWVRNVQGEPVTSFRVALMRAHPGRDPMLMNDLRVFKDAEGHFVFDRLDPGNYALQVRASGYAVGESEAFTVHREQETPPLEITLGRGGTLRGTVRNADGEPVRGALVEVHENEFRDLAINAIFGEALGSVELKIQTRTDAEGRYELEHLAPDTYQIRASHLDAPPAIVNDVVVVDDDRGSNPPLDLRLPSGASISGRAITDGGKPLAFATVHVNHTGGEITEAVTTDEGGQFHVGNLLEGEYQVRLQPEKDEQGKPLNPLVQLVYASKTQQTHYVRAGQQLTGLTLVAPRMTP